MFLCVYVFLMFIGLMLWPPDSEGNSVSEISSL